MLVSVYIVSWYIFFAKNCLFNCAVLIYASDMDNFANIKVYFFYIIPISVI